MSGHYQNFSFAQLVHQWSSKPEKVEKETPRAEPAPEPELKKLSKVEHLNLAGGCRIVVNPNAQKKASIDSPVGRQNLAKMNQLTQ